MTRLKHRGMLVLALCATVAGCGTNFPNTPTVPDPVPITEPPFTGTLTINGEVVQPFAVNASGNIDVTVLSLEDSNGPAAIGVEGLIRIGIALGTWNGTVCQLVLTNPNSFVGTVLTGTATAAGSLCVRVSDPGKLTEPVNFELKITHF